MGAHFVGLISGTSADGIDAALVRFDDHGAPALVAAASVPYDLMLRERIERAARAQTVALSEFASLDAAIGDAFGAAALSLLDRAGMDPASVAAVGSHGQTLGHFPGDASTVQCGDPNRIAAVTGIPVIADFRRADMAVGGQGAPLAPLFHATALRRSGAATVVINLGGIANVTVLHADGRVTGFDTGPANTLLDIWSQRHDRGTFDADGAFAREGRVDARLLGRLLDEPYFTAPPPKSTGREYFDAAWLDRRVDPQCDPADVQATLVELTAATVASAVADGGIRVRDAYVCGGGVHNPLLMERLGERLDATVQSTAALGIDPDFVEAMAFAWLARERVHARSPEALSDVTGAMRPAVLGGLWLPPRSPD